MFGQESSNGTHDILNEVKVLQDKILRLSKLLDVARFMSFERDLDRLLAFTAQQVTDGLGAERCAIFLLDEKNDEIWSRIVLGETEEIRFPKDRGFAGYTIQTGEVLVVPDAYADSRFNREIDVKTGFCTRSVMCVPLKNLENRTIGCFQVVNKSSGPFDTYDQEYLVAFGSQAAVAIESAQLYREKERVIQDLIAAQSDLKQKMRQLEIVYSLERSMNDSEGFDLFMGGVIQKATEALGAAGGSILLKEENSERILFSYQVGKESQKLSKLHLESDEGIAGFVMSSGESVLDNQVASNPNHSRRIASEVGVETVSIVAVPLQIRDVNSSEECTIGAVEIINHRAGGFSQDDLAVLQLISAQITSAIIRKRLLDEKVHSQRLATIGTLASTIIHDFKNPMAIIRGYAELLQRPTMDQDKREKFCKVVVGEVDRCVNMTKELLFFARGEKNYYFESISATDFVEDVALIIDHELKEHRIRFVKVLEYEGIVRIDSEKMKRVIFNLFNNALGVLTEGDTFSVSCKRIDDRIEFRVADTGPGVPKEIRKSLFNQFVTFGKKDGTGLGLSIAKDIVEGHGGKIFLDQSTEKGSVFVIQLPVPTESAETSA